MTIGYHILAGTVSDLEIDPPVEIPVDEYTPVDETGEPLTEEGEAEVFIPEEADIVLDDYIIPEEDVPPADDYIAPEEDVPPADDYIAPEEDVPPPTEDTVPPEDYTPPPPDTSSRPSQIEEPSTIEETRQVSAEEIYKRFKQPEVAKRPPTSGPTVGPTVNQTATVTRTAPVAARTSASVKAASPFAIMPTVETARTMTAPVSSAAHRSIAQALSSALKSPIVSSVAPTVSSALKSPIVSSAAPAVSSVMRAAPVVSPTAVPPSSQTFLSREPSTSQAAVPSTLSARSITRGYRALGGIDVPHPREGLMSWLPGAIGTLLGALLWKNHRVLGALGGEAIARNGYNLATSRTTLRAAGENMSVNVLATVGSLSLPSHPMLGYLGGLVAGGPLLAVARKLA